MKWILISYKDTDRTPVFYYDQRTITTTAYLISMALSIFRVPVGLQKKWNIKKMKLFQFLNGHFININTPCSNVQMTWNLTV